MDVVLEVFDTFLFDRLYASLRPIHQSSPPFDPGTTLAATPQSFAHQNATYNASGKAASPWSAWQFQPASSHFSVAPSEYAYMSRWDRDYIWRQAVSLYIVTW